MYSEEFEIFWKLCQWPIKGSKKKAFDQWKRHKKNMPHLYELETILQDQIEYKQYMEERGHWQPNFPHVERWIKHFRWEDELDITEDDRECVDPFERALEENNNR
jgi:hypothetical protein